MKKNFLLAAAIVLSCIFSSCSNEESAEKTVINPSGNLAARSTCTPENGDNPWDYYGRIHNEILATVVSKKDSLKDDTDATINYSFQELARHYDVRTLGGNSSVQQVRVVLADSVNFYNNIPASNRSYTAAVKSKAVEFLRIFQSAAAEEGLTYCTMKNRIVSFERSVLTSSSLRQSEKDDILKFTSVGRYSSYYWYQQMGQQTQYSTTARRPWWKWVIVGVSDVAGAITGNVAGALGASAGASTLVDWVAPDPT